MEFVAYDLPTYLSTKVGKVDKIPPKKVGKVAKFVKFWLEKWQKSYKKRL